MLVIAGQTAGPNWLNFFDETHDETSACNIYTVCLKKHGKRVYRLGCTWIFQIETIFKILVQFPIQ